MDSNNGNGTGAGATSAPAHNQNNPNGQPSGGSQQNKGAANMIRQGGQAQMGTPLANPAADHGSGANLGLSPGPGGAQPGGAAGDGRNSRKQKFLNQQQSQPQASPGGAAGGLPGPHGAAQGAKHKGNLSADNSAANALTQGGQPGQLSQGQNHNKHISMNALPYDKMKGLTPVSNKAGGANGGKNGLHL